MLTIGISLFPVAVCYKLVSCYNIILRYSNRLNSPSMTDDEHTLGTDARGGDVVVSVGGRECWDLVVSRVGGSDFRNKI